MKKRRKKRRPKRPRSQRAVVPGQWQSGVQELSNPEAGFMEVGMFALNAPDAPPAFQGQAIQTLLFHEVAPDEPCPCGNRRAFDECHRDPHRVPLLCRDLGTETYSEITAYETTLPVHDHRTATRLLKTAPELRLTQEIPGRLFWQFVGHPPVETQIGDVVFATVELNPERLYFVTLSQQRNQAIIFTLTGYVGGLVGSPLIQQLDVEHQYRQMIRQKKQ
jgi:hypothetical protein